MTTITAGSLHASTRQGRLPRVGIVGCVVLGYAVMAGVFALTPWQGKADYVVAGAVASVTLLVAVSWWLEGKRRARDRFAASFVSVCLLLMLLPLVFTIGYTLYRGLKRFSVSFLSHDMTGVGPLSSGGGIEHAIIGTLEQVALATLISLPLGLLVAIYVTEYGRGPLAFGVRFMIDVMTGIPSIVAGLFVLSFWVLIVRHGQQSGFAGSIALAILELPIIVRSAEEMILLVPRSLREASYALGVAKWRTILRVVLPTASTGIVTGAMLAIARVTGETAPLLLVTGNNLYVNGNPFSGQQEALPVYVYQGAGSSSGLDVDRAWAAAMTLILIVVLLYAAARLLTRRNALAR